MADFTITAVEDGYREWTGEHGTFRIFDVRFEGQQGNGEAEIKRKSSSPAPTVGEVIDAEIVQKAGRKPELKRVYKPPGGSGPRAGRSPQESAQIVRQHSQHVAILWAATLQKENGGKLPVREGEQPRDWLKHIIDWFDQDVKGVQI